MGFHEQKCAVNIEEMEVYCSRSRCGLECADQGEDHRTGPLVILDMQHCQFSAKIYPLKL